MANAVIKQKIAAGEFVTVPGVFDLMSTIMATKQGFDALYISGYWMTASRWGLPDAGVATYSEFIDGIRTIAEHTDAALIADADTGFGGLLNVQRTVRGYEAAGVTAIQIEDQEFPKKCGHTPHKQIIPADDMVTKVKVAVDTRRDENFLIIARTDARQGEGLAAAIDRAAQYGEAGADILFVEALHDEAEMRAVCDGLSWPLLANMAEGGITPILPEAELKGIGYALAIHPAAPAVAMLAAMNKVYAALAKGGTATDAGVDLYDFQTFCRDLGFEDVWAFEKKWGRYE